MAKPVLQTFPLGAQWPTLDPFLFVAHHRDSYPAGTDEFGPAASLEGRDIGRDFAGKDGWNMYHGAVVPGFPQHPHRGFETITYVREGHIDHADSLGATARFGEGDTQWMTAGAGIQHSEMFPLLRRDQPNPLEMFQIWLNLPAEDKMVEPYFTMFWSDETPTLDLVDDEGRATRVTLLAGDLDGQVAPDPPPNSWAARSEADVALWHISMDPDAHFTLPSIADTTNRVLYAFDGSSVELATPGDEETIDAGTGALVAGEAISLTAGRGGIDILLMQGRPIGEPVVQHGPFVMNTTEEIQQTFVHYQATQFGGWPWTDPAPHHGDREGRFALHADGRREEG